MRINVAVRASRPYTHRQCLLAVSPMMVEPRRTQGGWALRRRRGRRRHRQRDKANGLSLTVTASIGGCRRGQRLLSAMQREFARWRRPAATAAKQSSS